MAPESALSGLSGLLRWPLPWPVLLVLVAYAALSVACFAAYALDKSAAIAGRRRIPEATLLWLGLACGWPGGLLAQRLLRHKTRKRPFLLVFWATVWLNAGAFALVVYLVAAAGWLGGH
jgi:uncharacterized membrane protein YsdA (DUF1294 family)